MTEFNPQTHKYPAEVADSLRRKYLEGPFSAYVASRMNDNPEIRSCILSVAQYWNDEADDAVHNTITFSRHAEPEWEVLIEDYEGWNYGEAKDYKSLISDSRWDMAVAVWGYGHLFYDAHWQNNGEAITLFSAFCEEGGDQNRSTSENYSPIATFYRTKDEGPVTSEDIRMEFYGEKVRPHLDGIWPSYVDGDLEEERTTRGPMTGKAMEQWERIRDGLHPFALYFEGWHGVNTHPAEGENSWQRAALFRWTQDRGFANTKLTVREDFLPTVQKDNELCQMLQNEMKRRYEVLNGLWRYVYDNYKDQVR